MNARAKLERSLWRRWRQELPNPKSAQYEDRARKAFPRKGKSVSIQEIRKVLRSSALVVIGDDRLNPGHSIEVMRLIQTLPKKGSWAFLTDRFPHKARQSIERYVKGAGSLQSLQDSLGFDLPKPEAPEGGMGLWLNWLQRHRIPVHLLPSRSTSLADRDRLLAVEAKKMMEKGARVILWTGTLRLASCHLLKQFDVRKMTSTNLLLGVPELRWNSGMDGGWVRTSQTSFAFVGESPLLGLEYRRAWENRVSELVAPKTLEKFFIMALSKIEKHIHKPSARYSMKVFHPFDTDHLVQMDSQRRTSKTGKFLYERVLRHESAVIPESREVLLSTLEKGHIAEEAGHFLRLQGQRTEHFGPRRTALEEAFGFLASRWVDPQREIPSDDSAWMSLWGSVHLEGYELGAHLDRVWRQSKKGRDKIRFAWNQKISSEEDAQALWTHLRNIQ